MLHPRRLAIAGEAVRIRGSRCASRQTKDLKGMQDGSGGQGKNYTKNEGTSQCSLLPSDWGHYGKIFCMNKNLTMPTKLS